MAKTRLPRDVSWEVVVKETLLGALFIVLSAGIVVVIVGGIRNALKEAKRDDNEAE